MKIQHKQDQDSNVVSKQKMLNNVNLLEDFRPVAK